jgi:hypothetical protein
MPKSTGRRSPLLVIGAVGAVVSVVLFAVTAWRASDAPADFDFQNASGRPGGIHLSPYATRVVASGFDPWTGEPHGWSFTVPDKTGLGNDVVERGPVPHDIRSRWAIPLPLGFGLGAVAASLWFVVGSRRLTLARRAGVTLPNAD